MFIIINNVLTQCHLYMANYMYILYTNMYILYIVYRQRLCERNIECELCPHYRYPTVRVLYINVTVCACVCVCVCVCVSVLCLS